MKEIIMDTRTVQQQAADEIEQAHIEVGETTGLFAARHPVAGKVTPWVWHLIKMTDRPEIIAECGKDLSANELPKRRRLIKFGCDQCRVTEEQIDKANAILRSRFGS